ncbi:MAG: 3-deoxy-7-phosphoheptulonate synthase, partial [Oscillospiraceae bacterium]
MIVILKNGIEEKKVKNLTDWLENQGISIQAVMGEYQTILGLIGDTSKVDIDLIQGLDIVDTVKRISEPYKSANRKFHPDDTIVDVNGIKIGGGNFAVIAGPCSVESRDQIIEIAKAVKKCGANLLRGGAFKPRTSPYAFQGMGEEGLKLIRRACDKYNMAVTSEIMEISQLPLFLKYVDILQVGARNMQNFEMLKELGKIRKPILLKRGLANTIEEFLMSAEY